MKTLKTFLTTLAFIGLSVSAMSQSSTYTITNNGANFDLVKDGITPLVTNEPVLYYVMNAIEADAGGADCIIQLGDGTELDMGSGYRATPLIMFNGTWGEITLTGKATTAWTYATSTIGDIQVSSYLTLNCEAELTGATYYPLIYNFGTLNITGGKVETTASTGVVLCNEGTLTISGGTVQATAGINSIAISQTAGETTVSGTALVASKNAIGTSGTIAISGGTLSISGGMVENTADNGRAIYNTTGAVDISGGTVQTTGTNSITIENYLKGTLTISGGTVQSIGGFAAINHLSTGTINISGGTVSANSNYTIQSNYGGTINISGGTVSTLGVNGTALSSNYGGSTINISGGTLQATGIYGNAIELFVGNVTVSGTALITSENSSSTSSGTIAVSGGTLTITGGTVENTAEAGKAIYNNSAETVNISGGMVQATNNNGIAIHNASTGTIDISGGTVSAPDGLAVGNNSGTINISGGTVQSTGGYAIYNTFGAVTISGGTVSTTIGIAVANTEGTINITGGMVLATNGYAVVNNATEEAAITGGIIFAYGAGSADVMHGIYDQSGDAVIVAWNKTAGITAYDEGTTDDIYTLPAGATAVWASNEGAGGIAVDHGTTTGFIPLEVTVSTTVGIETAATDSPAVAGYYSILGQRLTQEPQSGIYIISYGGKAVKVIR